MDEHLKERFDASRARWERETLGPSLEEKAERREAFATLGGLPLQRMYDPLDLDVGGERYFETIGYPGEPPFTRGVYPAMYRQDHWIFGMYSGFGSAEDANRRFRHLLEQGQTGFSVALDLPTQMGLDPDAPLSCGEVGRVGVSLASLEDMERLFEGIPFERVRQIRTTANAIGPVFAAMVLALARKQGVDPRTIKLFIQNDVLKEYVARGTYIYPPGPSLKHTVDVVEHCSREGLDTWTPLAISGYHIRDAGATAVQELAFSLANAIAYFEEARSRGIHVDEFATNIWTFLAADIHLLEEVAKFRAARRVWYGIMKDRFGASDTRTLAYKIFAFTLGGRLTAQQPYNNLTRVALMALAAALGGVQTLHTTAFDEALSVPSQEAATLALRTQQIIAHETGVADVVDILGGSWAVEALTDLVEAKTLELLEQILELGGAVSCIEEGWFQKQLSANAYRYQMEIEAGERTVVGVNRFRADEGNPVRPFTVDDEPERRQVRRVRELRQSRDDARTHETLGHVEAAARRGENTLPPIIAAVEAYATIGEICDVLRGVWGTHEGVSTF